jgi:hypothetical protein
VSDKKPKPKPIVLGRGELLLRRERNSDPEPTSAELWAPGDLCKLYLKGKRAEDKMGTLVFIPDSPKPKRRKR